MADTTWYDNSNILIAVFEGWNDAAEASSSAITLLRDQLGLVELFEIEADEYIDYQYNRPVQSKDLQGAISLKWPGFKFYGNSSSENESKVYVFHGIEPSRKWQSFIAEMMECLAELDIDRIVILGSMLADVPHSRPISIVKTSHNPALRLELNAKQSEYQGPVGITNVLAQATDAVDIKTINLWASVPHYVHTPPSPKATLSILQSLQKLIGLNLDLAKLQTEAADWEEGINKIAEDDDEMSAYIARLESSRDAVEAPEASGDAIAKEFEKFLRTNEDEA